MRIIKFNFTLLMQLGFLKSEKKQCQGNLFFHQIGRSKLKLDVILFTLQKWTFTHGLCGALLLFWRYIALSNNEITRKRQDILQLLKSKQAVGGRPPQYARPWWPYIWPFYLESGVRVTCDVGYLCAFFGLPRPLCSRLTPDVRDRQTDSRQTSDVRQHRLMPPPIRGGGITTNAKYIIYITVYLAITTHITSRNFTFWQWSM